MAKFCTNCGAALDDSKKFCTECGTPMADVSAGQAAEPAAVAAGAARANAAPPPRQAAPSQPQYRQPQYQAVPQPVCAGEPQPAPGSKYEPITTGGYIGIMLLMCIPLVGLILAIVWALGGCRKINKRNLARASLIVMVIGLVLSLLLGVAAKSLVGKVKDAVEESTGISLSGDRDKNKEEDSGGLLGGLAGLLGGDDKTGSNDDLEALEDLEGLLGALGSDTGELGDAIDDIKDINADAEAKNDGWPKSLRKYPGGTAVATASYRTEISGTTAEEMMAWIDDLKSDGFQYQDFYDFGMTEEDMLSVNGWWATDGNIYISLSYQDGTVIVDHMNELPDMSSLLG